MHNFINTQTAPAACASCSFHSSYSSCCYSSCFSTRSLINCLLLHPAICDSLLVSCNSDPHFQSQSQLDAHTAPFTVDWIMAAEVSACLARSLCHNLFVNGLASWPRAGRVTPTQRVTPLYAPAQPVWLPPFLPACLHCDWSFAVASRRPHTPPGPVRVVACGCA